jgi:hypothetical protein
MRRERTTSGDDRGLGRRVVVSGGTALAALAALMATGTGRASAKADGTAGGTAGGTAPGTRPGWPMRPGECRSTLEVRRFSNGGVSPPRERRRP